MLNCIINNTFILNKLLKIKDISIVNKMKLLNIF
mgnify:CR=1 FL=1